MPHTFSIELVNGLASRLRTVSTAVDQLTSRTQREQAGSNISPELTLVVVGLLNNWADDTDGLADSLATVVDNIIDTPGSAAADNAAATVLSNRALFDPTNTTDGWAALKQQVSDLFQWPQDQEWAEAAAVESFLTDAVRYCKIGIDQLQEMTDATLPAATVADAVRTAGTEVASAVSNAPSYPVLTQEVGYGSPAPASSTAPAASGSGALGLNLGAVAAKAISDVLGWKAKSDDPKAFVGALNASFTCTDVEGHTVCTWTPRTYAIATDLAGGITGAQASIYSRAQAAVNNALPLLDGLYPLDPTADREDIDALKGVARNQMTEMVAELGMLGGPRSTRVSQYFSLLLDTAFPLLPGATIETDPNKIGGTLGTLRNVLGCAANDDFVNSVEDEQDVTNFRLLSDYMTSLAQSWVNNLPFFMTPPQPGTQPFFGTQLVLLSRQLSVIAESVEEVRFSMDSVFIGPAERQTLAILLQLGGQQPFSMYVDDLLSWVETFAIEEGPRLVQDGGKYAVGDSFARQASNLQLLVQAATQPVNIANLPDAYNTGRVQVAWRQLAAQLTNLVQIASPVRHKIQKTVAREVSSVVNILGKVDNFADLHQQLPSTGFLGPNAAVRFARPPRVMAAKRVI